MKKTILLSIILITFSTSYACDICGCGPGSYYVGLLPEFSKRFVGLRYQHSSLTNQLDINGQRTALTNDETYNTFEVWGAWNLGKRWRTMAILPYTFIKKVNEGTNSLNKKDGMGDIIINSYYNILNQANSKGEKLISQSLWIGVGLQLPSGQYRTKDYTPANTTSNSFQLGTGSTNILAHLMYDLRIQDVGINANASYKVNTENKEDYRYGNKISSNINAYYKISLGMAKRISPHIGIIYEQQQKDHTMDYIIDETGGNMISASLGTELNIGKISVGINYQKPVHQDLNNGRVKNNDKVVTHISFAF